MDGWKPVEQIAQLKWSMMATGIPLLNESEMASLILSMLTRMCQFYPSRSVCSVALLWILHMCSCNDLPHSHTVSIR